MPAHCVSVVKMASSLILKVFVVGNLKGKEQHGWMDGWMCTSGHACFAALHNVFGNLPNHF